MRPDGRALASGPDAKLATRAGVREPGRAGQAGTRGAVLSDVLAGTSQVQAA